MTSSFRNSDITTSNNDTTKLHDDFTKVTMTSSLYTTSRYFWAVNNIGIVLNIVIAYLGYDYSVQCTHYYILGYNYNGHGD